MNTNKLRLRKLWLCLMLLVGTTAIAVPALQEIAADDDATTKIGSLDDLIAFRDAVNGGINYSGKTVELTADIDMSSIENWVPIGNGVKAASFSGIFNGKNHTISNLKSHNETVAGLFGTFYGYINDLTLKNVDIESTHYAGGIGAYLGSENGKVINNCKVSGGTITSKPEIVKGSYDNGDKVGGILGYLAGSDKVTNCSVENVIIQGYRDLGGIVGMANSTTTVSGCSVSNVTIIQDNLNGYKTYAEVKNLAQEIAGRVSANATLTDNTYSNVTIRHINFGVAKIGDEEYETLAEAVAAVPAGTETTITMIDNEKIQGNAGVTIPAGKNIILDLNGKTITGIVTESKSAQTILNQGTLTVKDSSEDLTGTLTNEVSDTNAGSPGENKNWYSNVITNNGTLTVSSGNIANTGNGGACYAIDNITNSTLYTAILNINGGSISAVKTTIRMFCNSTTNDNTLNMTGGSVKGGNGIQTMMPNNNANKATVNISGGYIQGTYAWYDYGNKNVSTQFDNANYTISGGFFTGWIYSYGKDGFITGGYYNEELTDKYIAEGYIAAANTDEATKEAYPYIVREGTYVAQIVTGESVAKYETLEAAFAAANDGETITLLADCAGNGIKVAQGKYTEGLTVDFDGHTYTVDGETVGSTGTQTNGFQLLKDNNITFKGGTITSAKAKILVQNYSNLTLEGMTLSLNNADYNQAYTLSNNNGTVVIDGSTINANPAGGIAFDVCRYSSYPSVSVTVKGESTVNGDIEVWAQGNDPKDGMFLTVEAGTITGNLKLTPEAATAITNNPEKAAITKGNSVTLAAPADFKWKDNGDNTNTLVPCEYVALIGDTKYESLAEAVAAVPADGTETTITMIANEKIQGNAGATIPATKNVKLDLNGKTITLEVKEAKGSQLITNNGTLTITDSSEEQTGKLTNAAAEDLPVGSWPSYNYVTNIITNAGTLNVEAGTIQNTANGSICYAVDNNSTSNNATLNVKGGTLTAVGTAVRQFCNSATKENTVNVSGGEIVTNGSAALWIQLPGSNASTAPKATLNVTGGTLSGSSYAFYDYSSGNAYTNTSYNLSGGTFNGVIFSFGANITISDGTYSDDILINQTYPSDVSVTGGKFGGDVYTYGGSASEGFITGGIFASKTCEHEGETYDCYWLECLAEGYISTDNPDEATKAAYPYAVLPTSKVELILIDGEPYPVTVTSTYKKVTYRRTFTSTQKNNLQSWFVPFNYKITEDDAVNFQFYKIHMIAGAKEAGEVDNPDNVIIYIEKLPVGYELIANVPYLVRPLNVMQPHDFILEDVVLNAPKTTSTKHLETSEYKYDFYGCYNAVTPGYRQAYWMSASGYLAPSSADTLRSYRWYIKRTDNDFNVDAKTNFIFVESDEGEATGINGTSTPDDVEGVYSPNGVKLDVPQKGLNIIRYKNGETKKIIIK